jgi:Ca2+-binding RTX toxin-like protein
VKKRQKLSAPVDSPKSIRRSAARLQHAVVEALEGRSLISGTPIPDGISFSTGLVIVNTGPTDDTSVVSLVRGQVQVTLSRTTVKVIAGSVIRFTTNDPTRTFDTAAVHKIEFFGGDGNDKFTNATSIPCTALGDGGADILIGGSGKDILSGGLGDDSMVGNGGDDSITGGGGNDTGVCGDGNDTFTSSDGNDSVSGGNGNDIINVGNGNNTINGGAGNDSITAGSGNDLLMGGDGNDSINGGGGSDSLEGDAGNDALNGGAGSDTYVFVGASLGTDTITEASNIDEDKLDFSKFGSGGVIFLPTAATTTTSAPTALDTQPSIGPAAVVTNPIVGLKNGVELDTRISAVPLALRVDRFPTIVAPTGGVNVDLTKTGTLTINQNNLVLKIANATAIEDVIGSPYADVIKGNGRTNHISGGGGNDMLYAGTGRAILDGGANDDTLVTVGGSTSDQLTGGTGSDSFWLDINSTEKVTDASTAETNAHHVHRIVKFTPLKVNGVSVGTPSLQRLGQSIADPKTQAGDAVHYASFRSDPLFAPDGPSLNDIFQGNLGDCYFLSMLSGLAMNYPDTIRQTVVDLGDGTFAVDFHTALGLDAYLRIDADLPVYSDGSLAYAGVGHDNALWVPILEKAWAFYRNNGGRYDDVNGGNSPGIAQAAALHLTELSFPNWPPSNDPPGIFTSADQYLNTIDAQLKAGKAVTIGGPVHWELETVAGAKRGQHIYQAYKVLRDSHNKPITLVVRNPWGSTGPKNDGYLYLSEALVFGRSGGFAAYSPI